MNSTLSPQPIRVMLINDHKLLLWGLKKLIETDQRYEVSVASTSKTEALKQVKFHTFDIIVLNLAHRDSINLISELIEQTKAKIVCIADTEDTDTHDKAVVKGARGILTKNEDPDQLLKAIECVHRGELWINRDATSRILMEIAKANIPEAASREKTLLTSLTKKELHVYNTVTSSSDKTLKEIAGLLHTSDHTLRNHLGSIYSKLGVANRLELYVFSNQIPEKIGL